VTVVRKGEAEFSREHGSIKVLAGPRFGTELTVTAVHLTSAEFEAPHYHDQDKVIVVTAGVLEASIDGAVETLLSGDSLVVQAGSLHDLRCQFGETCDLILATPKTPRIFEPGGREVAAPAVAVGDECWTGPA